MLPFCEDQKIAVIPWSPLARGRLTRDWNESTSRQETDQFGKTLYNQAIDSDRKIIDAVGALATARGVSRAQIAHGLDRPEERRHSARSSAPPSRTI